MHDLDILRWLGGEVERVYAESTAVPDDEIETGLVATVRFRNGALGRPVLARC